MNMEFLYKNYVNTTTMLSVDSATGTVSYLIDRRPKRQYESDGYNNDLTTTTINIAFTETVTADRVVLQNINLKDFTIYYNGTTTNLFTGTTTCDTTSSDWTGNSATSLFYVFASATAFTSLSIKCDKTIVADQEKKIGMVWVTTRAFQFDRNPGLSGYSPKVQAKEYVHKMADGGSTVYRIQDKMQIDLTVTHRTDRATIETIYDLNQELVFVPFPTSSAWAGDIWETNWIGGFDYKRPSMDYTVNGYDAKITLAETPSR